MSDMQQCHTCMGEGVTANEYGPQECPDCCGLGQLPSASVLRERRLRELERMYSGGGETGQAVCWLADEVRGAHHALMQIMAAALEARDDDPVATKVRFVANQAIGLYRVEPNKPGRG